MIEAQMSFYNDRATHTMGGFDDYLTNFFSNIYFPCVFIHILFLSGYRCHTHNDDIEL